MKKTNLAEALKRVEEKPQTSRESRKAEPNTTREGKKTIAGFFPLEVSKQLKMIGLTNNKTVQDLMAEALNDLFTKYGKSPIA
jgi:hypothetical protein